ncbi:MBL fold metallo-hydrolase [Deinococcus cellulosilyticus]|uniref:MBL fold metallo-hydrolase n=1 Tax=Deinococcus cellulosilyticus (strain DSM 18568 / NBRC 106333 / KACC 11606 / 5516J-15) TaxID=1223518 RepID=A0A511MX35_DEIC1|nr:MBL fold metallo-hydrolase [Deinococcus cellulosilyticus]GEM45143.1 MBL fold metallo-hydrolase [Deinococcus cellulosilyticus NBRC 106333 = KACC 11606]
MPELVFMGTSDSKGVPRYYCECEICTEARKTGVNRRTRSSLLIQGEQNTLIDAGPDFHAQTTREGFTEIHQLLITHAHNDHVLGLGDLLDYRIYARGDLPMYAPEEVIPMVKARFSYVKLPDWLKPVASGLQLEGYQVSTFGVPHGANGFSYAYRFDRPDFSWVYCPDSINIPEETEQTHMMDLDLLILGTSFWQEPYPMQYRSVYDIQEALQLAAVKSAKQVIFTHMSHDIDARRVSKGEARLPDRVRLAFDGMRARVP